MTLLTIAVLVLPTTCFLLGIVVGYRMSRKDGS